MNTIAKKPYIRPSLMAYDFNYSKSFLQGTPAALPTQGKATEESGSEYDYDLGW